MLSALSPSEIEAVRNALVTVREVLSKLSGSHRDMHSSVSKVGKAIDRNFVTDFDSTSREGVFAGSEQQRMVNEVILQHFYRHGQLDLSDALAEEAGLAHDPKLSKRPFQELNAIVEALKEHELTPALEWAARHREELYDRGRAVITESHGRVAVSQISSLEMKLHKLQFIEYLKANNRLAAVHYARLVFPRFIKTHERDIQMLMGAAMFPGVDALAASPYRQLLDLSQWHEIREHFMKDACSLMGLSMDSPLSVVVNAGCTALPALLNIKQVMQQRQVSGVWNAKDELPIEIDLGPENRYHSIFACPILKQQTTDLNPPLRLTCGHCISRDALSKLSAGHKLKCPYCPVEQNPNDARQITF